MAMAPFFFVLLLLAFFSTLIHHPIPPVSTCPDVPSMTVEAACKNATGTRLMYELCKYALRDVTYTSNSVDLYAPVGAKRALASYADTAARAAGALRDNASLPADERDAYASCVDAYRAAMDTMADRVVAALVGCRFSDGDLGQVYRDGVAQVEGCRDHVMNLPASPIYARSLVDRSLAVLAYFLGKLLGIQ